MLTVAIVVVALCLVAALIDWRDRRRGSRSSGRAMAANVAERRRDVRASRAMRNLGGDPGSDRRR